MTKTKQATLFSLKSWKNVATEGIQKYKDILASHDEAEILKALISLKKKNFSRDVILSAGIDLSLKLLEKHQNPRICYEAQLLRSHWQLNKSCSPEIILLDNEEPPRKKRRTMPEVEVCEIKITHKQTIECNERLAVDHSQEKQVPNKAFLKDSNKSVPMAAAKPVKLDFKSPSVNKTTYNNIIHQLHAAIKLFTQELGEQEVRLYLGKDVKESSSLKQLKVRI
ncbi:uncharacterized protein LOC129963585 [Argiope bruennichi]|uniref:Uncharacterized protein n=1 Tax=Argiope bruennichi TaxID=94029 RepID=A0A8T0EVP4_ARGBR|nr:uncharacterized protein LOC129963585 [Argiope bruennichi]KAF8782180.1 hypothetical protein HNY73_012502 [Argiope bruennichi]